MKKNIATTIVDYLNEKVLSGLTLYRGEEKDWLTPTDNKYSFFAQDKSFAEDYGDYIWQCSFEPMNLFISHDKKSIVELYNNGFKLRDTYIEDNWGKEGTSYDGVVGLYEYDETKSSDTWGYKSAKHVISSPYFNSDTWEMIEHSEGVLEYIFSKYDGVELLEGGQKSYYLRTDKIISCEKIEG